MSVSLQKGQKVSLSKDNQGLAQVIVGLGWDEVKRKGGLFSRKPQAIDCDASAILLKNGKLCGKEDLVYFGNLRHKSDAVMHQGDNLTGAGDGDDEQIFVDLKAIPESVDKIAFTVTIYEAQERRQNFGQVSNAYIRIVDEDTNQKTEVGKTGDDKCFFAGCDGFFLGIIETDEQVRADAHQFPKDVHLENIGCYYQSQH